MWEQFRSGRRSLAEFDPGPTQPWAELFAQTPNYRGIAEQFTATTFRWHFGPMFYRGRTAPGSARVLVIGQEGAQDESLTHRSFTGGTGGHLQYVLDQLGITHSYMFLNTFAYTINGQYPDGVFRLLAQDPRSPIAQHRARILDLAAATHDLRLVIAVGVAAKESAATWLRAHGAQADPEKLVAADGSKVRAGLRFIGVPHPGAAAKGDAAGVVADFKAAMVQLETWTTKDPHWLPADPDGNRRPASAFRYKSSPVPFRDLPFGTAWRLGFSGTTSNRRDSQHSIQLFSADGEYNNDGVVVNYAIPAGSKTGYQQDPGDIEVEPPRVVPTGFDSGPGDFAALLTGAAPGLDWPDFHALGLIGHPSFGFGPSYRGRLDHPSVLVLADQSSQDDLFTTRALTGEAGQRLQGWLRAAGLTHRYAVLRTLPVDSLGVSEATVGAAVDAVVPVLRAVIAKASPGVLVALGPQAGRIIGAVGPAAVPRVAMRAWDSDATDDWRRALTELKTHDYPKDVATAAGWDGARSQIPREDLPYGMLRWQGTSGDRAGRATVAGADSPDYYKFAMPAWAAALHAPPLSAADQAAVDALKS